MLTRYHLSILGLLATAFLGITLYKFGGSVLSTEREANPDSSPDTLAQANQFWAIYRRATDTRTDGQYKEAVDFYREALDHRPSHRDARFYLAEALLQSGQLKAAERQWERLLKETPESARVQGQLAGLVLCSHLSTQHDLTRAKHHFRAVTRIHGEYDAEPSVRIAQILTVQDSLNRTEKTLDVISGRADVPAAVAFLRGYVAWREGRSQPATVSLARSRQALSTDTTEAGHDAGFRVPPKYRNDVCQALTNWRPTLLDRPPGQIQTDTVYSRFQKTLRKIRGTL